MRRGASRKSAERRIVPVCARADGMHISAANSNMMRCLSALPMPPPSPQALRVDAIATPKEAIMASGLEADEKGSGLERKVGRHPLPPFYVSAHSRRLRPLILLLRVPAAFVNKRGERTRIP